MLKIADGSAILQTTAVVGRLTRLTVFGSGWGIGTIRLPDSDDHISVVGEHLVGLSQGGDYRLVGKFEIHPSYGPQFKVSGSAVELQPDPAALQRHLQKNICGVGEATAARIVQKYQEEGKLQELRNILVDNPFALDLQAILGKKDPVKVETRHAEGAAEFVYRNLSVRLQSAKIKDAVLKKLAKYLFERNTEAANPIEACWRMFSEDPYLPSRQVNGYGFVQADHIGKALGLPNDAPCRLAALAVHALSEGCSHSGHTFLTLADFRQSIRRMDPGVLAADAIRVAIERGWPLKTDSDAGEGEASTLYYPLDLWHAERGIVSMLVERRKTPLKPIFDGTRDDALREIGFAERRILGEKRLDESQREALVSMMLSTDPLKTLTAGPGCGKTALMEILTDIVRSKRKVLYAAPTGKAAQVLAKRVRKFGMVASTLHSLLGAVGEGFVHDESNPLECDVLIVDEGSMVDILLAFALMNALPAHAHLVVLGDPGQLQSVGPGRWLADLMSIDGCHHRLSETHRNKGGILRVVMQIAQGVIDCVDVGPEVRFTHKLPQPDGDDLEKLVRTYSKFVEQSGIERVGLLMSTRVGDIKTPAWNTTYLNEVLRQRMNPGGARIPGLTVRVGDRVMIRKNMALPQPPEPNGEDKTERVVNGDSGVIIGCFMKDNSRTEVNHLRLLLDDGRDLQFAGTEVLEALSLGYAQTVHLSQGSEFADVIYIVTPGGESFVNRASTKTGASRAQQRLLFVGDDDTIRKIVRREAPKRNSRIVDRYRRFTQALEHPCCASPGHSGKGA